MHEVSSLKSAVQWIGTTFRAYRLALLGNAITADELLEWMAANQSEISERKIHETQRFQLKTAELRVMSFVDSSQDGKVYQTRCLYSRMQSQIWMSLMPLATIELHHVHIMPTSVPFASSQDIPRIELGSQLVPSLPAPCAALRRPAPPCAGACEALPTIATG